MSDPKKPLPPTSSGGSTNWGVLVLMAVIGCILLVAFAFDGTMGTPTRKISLEDFQKDYRQGKVVLNQPKDFPLSVTTGEGGGNGVIKAYEYRKTPEFPKGQFYMPFSDSTEVRDLCNRFGIVAVQRPSAQEEMPDISHAERVWSTDSFIRLGEEGRILVNEASPVIFEGDGNGVIVGEYRRDAEKAPAAKDLDYVQVEFSKDFQGERVRDLLGHHARYEVESNTWTVILINLLPVLLLFLLFIFLFRSQGGGGAALKFARSRARLLDPNTNKVTFKDVAGISEAKEELWEIVEFLRNPKKFRNLGGTIPKGVLMVGPPGTGKTLLARAIAGEAKVPFYSISGSDFMEMFVGVGASRVRDMFAEAKRQAPCLIFIDEIDAIGRHRGHGVGGGHDEREQTLNAMLVEMDGFTANENVIVIAATNREDVLDPALMRPGRFDRRVMVNLPDSKGREQILRVHARKLKLAPEVSLAPIALATTGFSGAELANLLNEAALIAARRNAAAVSQSDLEEAREKVRWGRERRSLVLTDKDKYNTAVHEAGHAICLLKTSLVKTLPLHKVTIIPRGHALGMTMMLPDQDQHSEYKSEMLDYIVMGMGGRCAEQVVFGDVSGGASGDIESVTSMARKMVCVYGMSEKLGPVRYNNGRHDEVFLARDLAQSRSFSEHTAQIIDEEIQRIVTENYDRAIAILTEYKERLLLIADKLIEFETLSGEQIAELLETGEMSSPPVRELPPDIPEETEEAPAATETDAAQQEQEAPEAEGADPEPTQEDTTQEYEKEQR